MPDTMKPIKTIEEYEHALRRIAALDVSMPDSPEEDELIALLAVVKKWEHDHAEIKRGTSSD